MSCKLHDSVLPSDVLLSIEKQLYRPSVNLVHLSNSSIRRTRPSVVEYTLKACADATELENMKFTRALMDI